MHHLRCLHRHAKAKTLQLFGRRPDPTQPPSEDNLPAPFHVYSMRQAIEEGFILDVLKNYTTYSLAFKLANGGQELSSDQVERSTAMKGLMNWVRLHPYNISQKVQIVVEHYRETVAHLLSGKAKAMVVVASRKEAVRWQLAMTKYIQEKGYPLRTLVAFSGEVEDKESGPDAFKETSASLNADLMGRDIAEAFKDDKYQILLVANKFQTGFDQPLLCGMYVDKRLDGIQAVQTLSRLNRCYPGKDDTFVLDFVNDADDILNAFKVYYTTAQLSGVTDPNIILDLRTKLDSLGYYDDHEIDRVVNVTLADKPTQKRLAAAIEPVRDRVLKRFAAAKESHTAALAVKDEKAAKSAKDIMDALILFKADMATYVRAYTFLSQIIDYGNTDFEKALDLLQAASPAPQVWPRERGHRPLRRRAHAPQAPQARRTCPATHRQGCAQARPADRDRQWISAREAASLPPRDHRAAQHALRHRYHGR